MSAVSARSVSLATAGTGLVVSNACCTVVPSRIRIAVSMLCLTRSPAATLCAERGVRSGLTDAGARALRGTKAWSLPVAGVVRGVLFAFGVPGSLVGESASGRRGRSRDRRAAVYGSS